MIMKYRCLIFTFLMFGVSQLHGQEIASKASYLEKIKAEMLVEWPKNRTINLVFHGHSVPAGYFKTPTVNTLASYPYLVLKDIKSSDSSFTEKGNKRKNLLRPTNGSPV